MNPIKLAYRKLHLQYLQLKHLSPDRTSPRYKEQVTVLFLLLSPKALFTLNRQDVNKHHLYKYINVLNANVKNDTFYRLLVEAMKEE